jgi:hypothetical protein
MAKKTTGTSAPKLYHAIEAYKTGTGTAKKITFKSAKLKESKSFKIPTAHRATPINTLAALIFKANKYPAATHAETAKGFIFFSPKFESLKTLKPL